MRIVTDPACYEELIAKPYALFQYEHKGQLFRVESTPVSLTAANVKSKDGGWFSYRLPKIPYSVLRGIMKFFLHVAQGLQTEVLVRIYYEPMSGSYLLEVPDQMVSPSSVETKDGYLGGLYPVMDIHSHCFFSAFFSGVDNADELSNRLYGVIGSLDKRPQFLLRAGTGGQFVDISCPDDVFGESQDDTDWFGYLVKCMDRIHKL